MRRVSMLGVSFDEKFVDWLIENVSPLENPDNRLRGLTWSIYWYHTPNISGFGLNLFPTMEISFLFPSYNCAKVYSCGRQA